MFRFAVRNLLSRPVRSLLSLLGLTVAIAGMVGLFSVAEGLNRLMTDTFGRIPGLVAVQPGAPIPLFSRLPAAWKQELEKVDGVEVVTAEVWQRVNVVNGEVILTPPRFLFGTDIESRINLKHSVYQTDMQEGRFLAMKDEGTFNTVISRQIANQFKVGVGETFVVNGSELTVVGIYECGSLLLDVAIILDISIVREMTRFEPDSVSAFYIEQQEGVDADELAAEIRDRFRDYDIDPWKPSSLLGGSEAKSLGGIANQIGKGIMDFATGNQPESEKNQSQSDLDPRRDSSSKRSQKKVDDKSMLNIDDSAPIEVRSAVEWASRFERMSDDLNIILTILTSIGVIIAVLSIVNTMLMSVSERMIEFGILKANGWSRRDVMKLIAFESAIIGILGGIFGALFGWIGTQVVNAAWPMRAQLYASPNLLAFAVVFSIALGLLGGLYPAIRAMRMMPMQALRRG